MVIVDVVINLLIRKPYLIAMIITMIMTITNVIIDFRINANFAFSCNLVPRARETKHCRPAHDRSDRASFVNLKPTCF